MTNRQDSDDGWNRARELFFECIDLEVGAREIVLERLQREDPPLATWVRRLLAQDEQAREPSMPRRCGPYALLRRIGSGGMGEVFLGRRVDGEYEREVAIKLQRSGRANELVARRFLRERQTLAQLDHEYIARLYDGGTTAEGEPYLVLEYVEGLALDEFCARNALDVRARLELFARVLAAVAHAHARGVVHRDLKPSNVLVRADGMPRLLDFGIARPRDEVATPAGPLTRTGQRLFTPEYASPEQVQGRDVSPASDVFALGVLLYQLLCGERPWSAGLSQHELEHAIVESEPAPPSRRSSGTARRLLVGDLDTIVLKCLAKEPHRRYVDAAELAVDIELHLRGFPIRARRTGFSQRAWRYGRRKPWLALACAALCATSIAITAAWRARLANERSRAEVLESVRTRLDSARDLRDQGRVADSAALLDSALGSLADHPDQRLLRAEVLVQIAVAANYSERWSDAITRLGEARGELVADPAEAPRLWASFLNARALALRKAGAIDKASKAVREALDHADAHLDRGDDLWLDAVIEFNDQRRSRGDTEQALASLAAAIDERRARGTPHDTGLAQLVNARAVALRSAGRPADALEPLEEALAIYGWHFGDGHPQVGALHMNVADMLFDLGRHPQARERFERALAAFRAHDVPAEIARALMRLGQLALASREPARALELLQESEATIRAVVVEQHPVIRKLASYIGNAQADAGDLQGARTTLEFALEPTHGVAAYGPEIEADARACLGGVLVRLGEREAARAQYAHAIALREKALGSDHASTCALRELLEAL